MLNVIEEYSIIAGVSVALLSIFFLEPLPENQNRMSIAIFIIMTFINAAFLCLWLHAIVKILYGKVALFVTKLKKGEGATGMTKKTSQEGRNKKMIMMMEES